MKNKLIYLTSALTLATSALRAQDSGPLIDKLVQKGILTDQEAEDLRADLVKDYNQTSAGKLNISNSVTELNLSGDVRYRWQYDDAQNQVVDNRSTTSTGGAVANPGADSRHVTQRSRNRFRLRLNADFKFVNNFFGGVGLQTGKTADSGNQTTDPGYSNSNIYISKAFLGYNVSDWATVVLGKQKNPFYTNGELVWDSDINPTGITESISFDKLLAKRETYAATSGGGYDKDGKAITASPAIASSHGFDWGKFGLTFVGGQFVFSTDNDESQADNDAGSDAYFFEQQLVATYTWDSKTSITLAPAFLFYNAADISGLTSDSNTQYFSDALGVQKGNSISSAGFIAPISGETRNLAIIDVPGEIKFPLGPLNAKLTWDFAWNTQGEKRYSETYALGYTVTRLNTAGTDVIRDPITTAPVQYDPVAGTAVAADFIPRNHRDRDDIAWQVGAEIGQGKGKGAWTLFANYREVGISSIDPNINDSDFALSRLNVRGFKLGATYWLTDYINLALVAQLATNLDDNLVGGQATGGSKLADLNSANIYQVDFNWKF